MKKFWVILVVVLISAGILWQLVRLFAPVNVIDSTVTIKSGGSLTKLVADLESVGVEFSWLEARMLYVYHGPGLQAGTYQWSDRVSRSEIINSVVNHTNIVPAVQLVIPEGFSNQKIYDRLEAIQQESPLNAFDLSEFINLTESYEGYLFPDTYFIYPQTTARELFELIQTNFNNQITKLDRQPTREEVIMASIIEREVITQEDRRLVADILWRRIELGMRLQVDASLDYYLDKPSSEITQSELDADHPYNTYQRTGLPPTPISNPGIDSIKAAMYPISNNYLFYLSSEDGTTYFAEDLEGHRNNRQFL